MPDEGSPAAAEPTQDSKGRAFISMAKLAEHSKRDSVWMTIHGKVYDVTKYLDDHPGGEEVLLDRAGKDATEDYEDVGHSNEARKALLPLEIGEISPSEQKAATIQRMGVSRSTPRMAELAFGAPANSVWNDEIRQSWSRAYSSYAGGTTNYEITDVEGVIPATLRGTVFRNGPGNFERGGRRFKHVLDGDGLICRIAIDGSTGRASFASKFVLTPSYVAEEQADDMWGGKLLALWEAALPVRLDPHTLDYMSKETFDGALPDGWATVTSGAEAIDRGLGLGVAFTAHPREDRKRGRMVGWSWAASVGREELAATLYEMDTISGKILATTPVKLPAAVAPHDFAITDNYYIFVLNGMELNLAPYILGLTGPVGALLTTGQGVRLYIVPRPGGAADGRKPVAVSTADPYFCIHHANAFEELPVAAGAAPLIRLYTAAWPSVGRGPFLGDWGGEVPLYDDGKIAPTMLLQSTIRLFPDGASVERSIVAGKACIDHPHVDPRFEGDARCRYLYMSYCNDLDSEGQPGASVSGSPPIGYARWDRHTDETIVWRAPPNTFCEEV
ncbi:retinal pigment epithelial membrane protein, partial [Chrysochromulina tobinii]